MQERIQKILAQAGIASRRKCEQLIAEGKVQVNGKTATLGEKASPEDKITVEGKPIILQKKTYIALNKPRGYVTTVSEQHGMKTVMDLVKIKQRVYPVGRLDKHTEGLLLLTNDGEFANKLTHPRYEIEKEYYVELDKPLSQEEIDHLNRGVMIDDRKIRIKDLEIRNKEVLLRIHEGRKHIVRRIFEKLGKEVKRLVRTRIAMLELGDLQRGKWRYLTPAEIKQIRTHSTSR